VYYSAIGDPTGWNPANNLGAGFLDFDPNDGQPVTGLGTVGPYVLVCKPRKLFIITQPGNAAVRTTVRRLSENIGCVAHRSIAQDSTGTYFLAEDRNVYVTNGSKITPIADIIQPTIDSVVDRTKAVGVCFAGHYYLSVGLSGPSPDTTLDFDTLIGSWWKHTFASNQFAIWHPTGRAQLFSAKSTSAIVDQCFVPGVWTDNGANVTWSWYGPWQSPSFYRRRLFPTTYMAKNLRQVRIEGSGTVDYYFARDFEGGMGTQRGTNIVPTNSAATWGDSGYTWGDPRLTWGGPSVTRARFFSLGVAHAFSQIFTATSNTPAEIDSFTLFMTDRKDLVVS
jgi:hypothetical protein